MRVVGVMVFVCLLAGILPSIASAGGYTDASYLTPIGIVPLGHSQEAAEPRGLTSTSDRLDGSRRCPGLGSTDSGPQRGNMGATRPTDTSRA